MRLRWRSRDWDVAFWTSIRRVSGEAEGASLALVRGITQCGAFENGS